MREKLCIHTITTKQWNLEQALKAYAEKGITGISIWQNAVEPYGTKRASEIIASFPIEVVSYVRGGFFPAPTQGERKKAVDHNRKLIQESAEIGAPLLVLVCGAHPQIDLTESRKMIEEGIAQLAPYAQELGVKLGIEPLHPMYAYQRSAINTVKQANNMAERLDSAGVGVVIDVYHIWWEEGLKEEILRCGRNGNLFAYHICDYRTPLSDMLNDRELMGRGCVPLKKIAGWIEAAGFKGYHEVEIFSNTYWQKEPTEWLDEIITAYDETYQ